ncbi:MAG TPA: hypothetical protein VFN67_04645 [Polyangiales bacterium]|nr:hypothetical protein [Polyangiales bacterium]
MEIGNNRPAAVRCSVAVLLTLLASACGPQRVPYPTRPRPGSAGRDQPEGGNAGMVAPTGGVGGSRTGSGGERAGTAADGGGGSQPQAGSSEAGTSGGGLPFDAGSDPNRNQVRPGNLCARLATIQCAAEAHCCFAPGRSVEACENDIRTTCANELFLDQIAMDAITGFDAAAAAAAYTELERRSSECDLGIGEWGLQALRGILKGTLAPGRSCKPPGASSVTDKRAQAAALASCTNIDEYACLPMSLLGDWTCATKNDSGGNCVTEDNCRAGRYCRNPNMQPLGKCAQRLALGASCGAGADCASLYCKGGKCVAVEQQVVFCLE